MVEDGIFAFPALLAAAVLVDPIDELFNGAAAPIGPLAYCGAADVLGPAWTCGVGATVGLVTGDAEVDVGAVTTRVGAIELGVNPVFGFVRLPFPKSTGGGGVMETRVLSVIRQSFVSN